MKNLEKILKGLANKRRLTIFKLLLKKKELNVMEIASILNLSLKATSKHLGILRQLDIVDKSQISLNVYYYLLHPLPPAAQCLLKLISNSRE